jgi:hypothetical protein
VAGATSATRRRIASYIFFRTESDDEFDIQLGIDPPTFVSAVYVTWVRVPPSSGSRSHVPSAMRRRTWPLLSGSASGTAVHELLQMDVGDEPGVVTT